MDSLTSQLEGEFKYLRTYLCCCSQIIYLYMTIFSDSVVFFYDKSKKKQFLQLKKSQIVKVHKRHIRVDDRYTLSIHYLDHLSELRELKLRCPGRNQLESWLARFNEVIQPKPFEFFYNTEKYEDSSVLFPIKDTQKFYLKTSYLEYILSKGDMMRFLRLLRENSETVQMRDEIISGRKGELNEKEIAIKIKG